MAHLSPQEVTHFHDQGYVIPGFRLDDQRVAEMVGALDELICQNPGVRPEKLVSAHVQGGAGGNAEGVRGSRQFLDLAMDPAIVELVSGVVGDDVILWG